MKLFVCCPWPSPEPRRALLISYGVGSTARALADAAGLEPIDVVDISRDVLEMARRISRGAASIRSAIRGARPRRGRPLLPADDAARLRPHHGRAAATRAPAS